ncbi:transposase [Streptomyces sp. NPDC058632]|uniref:transposase n=1 Tax=unclassified Streptomyces TaxID=2593676 RepID=UPI003662644F
MPSTDAQWARIEPLLPDRTPKRGGRRRDHRGVIDAIAYEFQTGTQWVHLPEKYGNWRGIATRYEKTVTVHLARLHIAGVFLRPAR